MALKVTIKIKSNKNQVDVYDAGVGHEVFRQLGTALILYPANNKMNVWLQGAYEENILARSRTSSLL
jgi:hypothetical protein